VYLQKNEEMKSGAGRKDVGKQRRNEAQNTDGKNAVWEQGTSGHGGNVGKNRKRMSKWRT
jgi:hypothetical protein